MHSRNTYIITGLVSAIVLLTLASLACSVPYTSQSTPEIPDEVLTAAVKTMQAKFAIATLTAIPKTMFPSVTPTNTKLPEETNTPKPTVTQIATATSAPPENPTNVYKPQNSNPTPVLNISSKPGYKIMAVNIHKCGKVFNAFLTVSNISDNTLQSAIIQIEDKTTGKKLYGPTTTNAPFRAYDDDCSNHIQALKGHHTAFVAAPLSKKSLKGHTIWGSMTFCSKDNLGGICYQDTFEFVYP